MGTSGTWYDKRNADDKVSVLTAVVAATNTWVLARRAINAKAFLRNITIFAYDSSKAS